MQMAHNQRFHNFYSRLSLAIELMCVCKPKLRHGSHFQLHKAFRCIVGGSGKYDYNIYRHTQLELYRATLPTEGIAHLNSQLTNTNHAACIVYTIGTQLTVPIVTYLSIFRSDFEHVFPAAGLLEDLYSARLPVAR